MQYPKFSPFVGPRYKVRFEPFIGLECIVVSDKNKTYNRAGAVVGISPTFSTVTVRVDSEVLKFNCIKGVYFENTRAGLSLRHYEK